MKKIKNFIQKYSIAILCCLVLLVGFKQCQLSRSARQITYTQLQYGSKIDSLQNINVQLYDSIKLLNAENKSLKELVNVTKGSLEHAQRTSTELTKANRNLSEMTKNN